MNNEEKKPIAGEEVVENTSQASDSSASAKASGFGGWWKSLTVGIKAAIIAGISCVLIAVVVLIAVLGGGKEPDGPSGGPGGNNGGSGKTVTYSITVVTKGGMAFNKLPVYIHEIEDGSIGDMVDGGYGATDENGKVSFKLPEGGEYAAVINNTVALDGYDALDFYPLVSADLKIVISSSVIPETILSGVTYNPGSVMHDFTVNSTVLVDDGKGGLKFEDQVFTLSEALKTKKAVLINFWYTTCSWCITEFPYMQKAYENYSDDLAIIALDPYADDSLAMIQSFQAEMGLTFNVAQDPYGISSAFNVTGYPTSVMVDRYGVVTLVEAGAIPSERAFNLLFEYYTADNYEQKIINTVNDIVPREKPDVEMPSADEFGGVFEKDDLGDINYRNDENDEYSWPFITGTIGEGDNAINCVYPSNAFKEDSYAQLLFDVYLKAGDVLAFDYFSSSELGADILYVVVDGKDIYSISGESTDWATCYSFVAEEDGVYEVGLVYAKDSSDDVGHDTVYLKDLRIVSEADIDSPTYIYRFAATNPDKFNNYQDYAEIFLGSDGYYHVDSADGPILLANLMSYTRFADDITVYEIIVELLNDKNISAAEYDKLISYCNYASNASIYGVSPVTPELKELFTKVVEFYGNPDNENDWMRICCYYDAYGTDKQLEDPIKGLALFSAYEVIESEKGSTDFPNSFTYNRVIMPRGLLGKFTPTVSGTYLIISNTHDDKTNTDYECNAWIFTDDGFGQRTPWLTYENTDRHMVTDNNNCYMIAYLEAGKDYYIDIAFYDVYQEGTISYRVERIGGEGYYRFTLASPAFFTTLVDSNDQMTGYIISGGIALELGDDGIWREKRNDGITGSILYADFTNKTPMLSHSLIEMIDMGAFDFSRTENDQYILNYIALNDNDVEKCDEYLRNLWGDTYEEYAEIYKLQEVYNTFVNGGDYHGKGKNYTDLARSYVDKIIVEGYNEQLGEVIAKDDARIGCVVVTKDLADLLQLIMNKYTFMNGVEPNQTPVENSWAKLCYYTQYFNAATPK